MNHVKKKTDSIYTLIRRRTNPAVNRIGLWELKPRNNSLVIRNNWFARLGYKKNKPVTPDSIKSLIHPEDIDNLIKTIETAASENKEIEFENEFRIMNAAGEWTWIYLNGYIGRKRRGRSLRISGTVIDVNTRLTLQNELKERTEELEALYEESESQNEELATMMEELHTNHMELEEAASNISISEKKLRSIFENAPFGIIQSTLGGEILNVNSTFLKIFKYDSLPDLKDHVNNTSEFYKSSEVREKALDDINSGGIIHRLSQQGIDKPGNTIHLNIRYLRSKNNTTGEIYLTTFVEDISNLTSSRFERDLFFNNSADLLVINNFNGTIKQLSKSWTKTLGWTEKEFLRMKRIEIIHPDDREKTSDFMKQLKKTEGTMSITNRYMHKEGGYRIIRWTCISFKELQLIFAIGRDETERHEAEIELQKMWDRLDLAIENGVIGLWDYNIKEDKLIVNKNMADFLGFDIHMISESEKVWPKFLHADDVENSMRAMKNCLKGISEYYIDQYRLKLPDGSYKWFFSRGKITEYDERGRPLKISGSIMDITEQKEAEEKRVRLEQKMQQAQKLESLGILAGGIAHDFNNLLTGLLGNADLLLCKTEEDSEYYTELNEIKKTAIRASELTNQMLAYSGKSRFIVGTVELNHLITEMESLIAISISKKVKITYEFHKEISHIKGDATQIRQILMNLVLNASDSLNKNSGNIIIKTDKIYLSAEDITDMTVKFSMEPGEYVCLEITDNGCGIAPDKIKNIFDPFFTTKFTGRGLGLAAVQGIIKSHNSGLILQSELQKGTSFRIFFPATDEVHAETAETEVIRLNKENNESTVMIVDDEKYIRELAAKMLKNSGYIPLSAQDGNEAVKRVEERGSDIACIILDMTMPDLDGEESLKKIRKINSTIPVIISSGYCEDEIINRFNHDEISGFLQKPYQINDLLRVLKNAIG